METIQKDWAESATRALAMFYGKHQCSSGSRVD